MAAIAKLLPCLVLGTLAASCARSSTQVSPTEQAQSVAHSGPAAPPDDRLSAADQARAKVDALLKDKPSTKPSPIYAPMLFRADADPLRTGACLSLGEVQPADEYGGVGTIFNALVAAFQAKDASAYEALSKKPSAGDASCPDPMSGYFKMWGAITSWRILRVFTFDDMVVASVSAHSADGDTPFQFEFQRTAEGRLEFLPCGARSLSNELVSDWLRHLIGGEAEPARCASEVVEHAKYRLPIGSEQAGVSALQVLVPGAPVDTPGELRGVVARVTTAFNGIKRALKAKDVVSLAKYMSERSAERLRDAWKTADPAARQGLIDSITQQEPFFVFDASPLLIAYTRGPAGIQVMYFAASGKDRVVWTNGFHVTQADHAFKGDVLTAAASQPTPFSNLRIK